MTFPLSDPRLTTLRNPKVKPPGKLRINWAHPMTRDLQTFFVVEEDPFGMRNIASSRWLDVAVPGSHAGGAPDLVQTANGTAFLFDAVDGFIDGGTDWLGLYDAERGATVAGAFTVLDYTAVGGALAWQYIIGRYASLNNSGHVLLEMNSMQDGSKKSLQTNGWDAGTPDEYAAPPANEYTNVVGSHYDPGTNQKGYQFRNGFESPQVVGSLGLGAGPFHLVEVPASTQLHIGGRVDVQTDILDGYLYYYALWSRRMAKAEMAAFSADPYQIVLPEKTATIFLPSFVTTTDVTLSNIAATGIGATSVDPTVDINYG